MLMAKETRNILRLHLHCENAYGVISVTCNNMQYYEATCNYTNMSSWRYATYVRCNGCGMPSGSHIRPQLESPSCILIHMEHPNPITERLDIKKISSKQSCWILWIWIGTTAFKFEKGWISVLEGIQEGLFMWICFCY